MKDSQSPLRSQRQHRGWPLDYDLLYWIGAVALLLLLAGADRLLVPGFSGAKSIELQRSIPEASRPATSPTNRQ
ncbi:hypothetical protein JVX91_17860 [Pseudomonas sp. PDNC002]|uniref:hypothetical protein n=1 Tax=Pseudomonas sp. PDNC002 TaxID=2811422 RepID=UPI0019654675|nr:hypothetical protein [Pseudomonas sp. PDNC002]QRY77467.1 hypothetical protein JVX91_17860 [Pseudomonas sp. PDNC002]